MRKRTGIVATGVGVVTIGLTVLGGSLANAAVTPQTTEDSSTSTTPNVHAESGDYYTEKQIDAVWAKLVSEYPEPLPAGVSFPEDAPGFFHPLEEGPHVFEPGLPELIAARYWRCAWLDASIDANMRRSASESRVASEALSEYSALPDVSDFVDVKSYAFQMAEAAADAGKDASQFEYDLECGFFEDEDDK